MNQGSDHQQVPDGIDYGWYVYQQGRQKGPYREAQLVELLRKGQISPALSARPASSTVFRPLCEWPAFASVCPAPTEPPAVPQMTCVPEAGVGAAPNPVTPPPALPRFGWDPRVVAWLGLLFSPLWTAIIAAVNSRRLRTTLPIWRPLTIGVGVTIADLLLGALGIDFYVLDLLLYFGGLGFIWFLDLRLQVPSFKLQQTAYGRQGGWLVPALTGVPAALLVILGFVILPLLPLEPRQVCQRFVEAKTLSEAERYTTINLLPALTRIFALPDDDNFRGKFELTDEAWGATKLDEYFVGWRACLVQNGEPLTIEGAFQLVNYDGPWKVNEWLIMVPQENQAEPGWIAISKTYETLFPAPVSAPAPRQSTGITTAGVKNSINAIPKISAVGKFVNSADRKLPTAAAKTESVAVKVWKGIGHYIIGIGVAIAAIYKGIFGDSKGPKSDEANKNTAR